MSRFLMRMHPWDTSPGEQIRAVGPVDAHEASARPVGQHRRAGTRAEGDGPVERTAITHELVAYEEAPARGRPLGKPHAHGGPEDAAAVTQQRQPAAANVHHQPRPHVPEAADPRAAAPIPCCRSAGWPAALAARRGPADRRSGRCTSTRLDVPSGVRAAQAGDRAGSARRRRAGDHCATHRGPGGAWCRRAQGRRRRHVQGGRGRRRPGRAGRSRDPLTGADSAAGHSEHGQQPYRGARAATSAAAGRRLRKAAIGTSACEARARFRSVDGAVITKLVEHDPLVPCFFDLGWSKAFFGRLGADQVAHPGCVTGLHRVDRDRCRRARSSPSGAGLALVGGHRQVLERDGGLAGRHRDPPWCPGSRTKAAPLPCFRARRGRPSRAPARPLRRPCRGRSGSPLQRPCMRSASV